MKRKRLSELVREEIASQVASPGEHREEVAPSEVTPPEVAFPPREHPGDLAAPPPGKRVPPYLTYVRKECRLRPDQLDALTALARRLNRERKGRGERITENTLLRVAIDLLLSLSEEKVADLVLGGRNAIQGRE